MSLLRSLMIPRVAIYHGFSHLSTCFNIPGTRAQAWMEYTRCLSQWWLPRYGTVHRSALAPQARIATRARLHDCHAPARALARCLHILEHTYTSRGGSTDSASHISGHLTLGTVHSLSSPRKQGLLQGRYNTTAYRPSTTGRHSVVKRASMCVPAGARW